MAKKKQTSKNKKQNKTRKTKSKKLFQTEVTGLLCILLAVFSIGSTFIGDGFIPTLLENAWRFLFGFWYFITAVVLFILGFYIVIKRTLPTFFTKRAIGLYVLFLGLLLSTHILLFDRMPASVGDVSVMQTTWSNYVQFVKGNAGSNVLGGGMIGALFYAISHYLFSSLGSKVVVIFIFLLSILILTNVSFGDWMTRIRAFIQNKWSQWQEKQQSKKQQSASETENVTEKESESKASEEEFSVQYSFEESSGQMSFQPEDTTEEEAEQSNQESAVEEILHTNVDTDNEQYELPSLKLLNNPKKQSQQNEKAQIQNIVGVLEETFDSFNVKAKVAKAHVGPAVTKYEVHPDSGVKVSKILNLQDDLALALAAQDIRIEAPIPGKSAVGIEVPNQEIAMVSLKEVIEKPQNSVKKLLFALGRDISGNTIEEELNKLPHLLIAGATGSGKSVCVNGIITSILMRAKPQEVKMMMIDPKKVELNVYNGIPHLLTPVVTDPKKASMALKKVVAEMEYRYELFSETGTRNMESYNEYITKQNEENEEKKATLPYIVVLVDELADLMMVASKDVEDSITRLAQMARAAGIHLIIATQRPSVDVITGVIKANIPSRIAFSVSSSVDSRTILDVGGAEKLLGRGDMLYIPVGRSKPLRVQGAFLSDEEVERVVNHCVEQQKAQYQEDMIPDEVPEETEEAEDELFEEAVQLVREMQSASVSMLQRRFRIGYNRAARLIDAMEDRQIVGPYEGNKPRVVYISKEDDETSG
ncbi:MAG TPA: DNA translocase FtsK [Pseudogracilibacillus sp.]|nr:DNA translocase FtsK [Pseudogracilibacillus sp.]